MASTDNTQVEDSGQPCWICSRALVDQTWSVIGQIGLRAENSQRVCMYLSGLKGCSQLIGQSGFKLVPCSWYASLKYFTYLETPLNRFEAKFAQGLMLLNWAHAQSFKLVMILQVVEFSIFLLISAWALQQCRTRAWLWRFTCMNFTVTELLTLKNGENVVYSNDERNSFMEVGQSFKFTVIWASGSSCQWRQYNIW